MQLVSPLDQTSTTSTQEQSTSNFQENCTGVLMKRFLRWSKGCSLSTISPTRHLYYSLIKGHCILMLFKFVTCLK